MPLTADRDIARVLSSVRRIALLGASANIQRPSHRVMQFLLEQGYEVYPVNPGLAGQTLLGRPVYAAIADIPAVVDMADVFRHARYLDEIVDQVSCAGIKILWTQLDVVDEYALGRAEQLGLEVVMSRCPAIEWPRLQAAGLIS